MHQNTEKFKYEMTKEKLTSTAEVDYARELEVKLKLM